MPRLTPSSPHAPTAQTTPARPPLSADDLPVPPSTQLADRLRVVVGRLRRRMREIGDGDDLSGPQTAVLSRLAAGEASSTSALAALEGVRPQSMASTLAPMEERGLIARRPDPTDGRVQLIELTDAGRDRFVSTRAARGRWLAEAIETGFTDDERLRLLEALDLMERLARS